MEHHRPKPRRQPQLPNSFKQQEVGEARLVCKYRLLPKRGEYKAVLKSDKNTTKCAFLTNFYEFTQQEKDFVYTYFIETNPPIPADNSEAWFQINKKLGKLDINRKIEVITHRANTIWANKSIEGVYENVVRIGKPTINYQVRIQKTGQINMHKLFQDADNQTKPLYVQMINNKIKEKLVDFDFDELGKGRFYRCSDVKKDQQMINKIGLTVNKGFRFTLVCLAPEKKYLQIDTCSRILQSLTFEDTLMQARGGASEKNQVFKGATVIARYGKHKTYVIQEIDYNQSPNSFFSAKVNGQDKQLTFAEYFLHSYQIQIKNLKQPLIKAQLKVDKKIGKGNKLTKTTSILFLIPELVSLTGMMQYQRKDMMVMREIAQQTKMEPINRFKRTGQLLNALNKESKKMISVGNPVRMEGYKLKMPGIQLKNQTITPNEGGDFTFQAPIKEPIVFPKGQWMFAYSNRLTTDQAQSYFNTLQQASACYDISFEVPHLIKVNYGDGSKDGAESWVRAIQEKAKQCQIATKKRLRMTIVLIFKDKQTALYDRIKQYCTKDLRVRTQFFRTETLDHQAKRMSAAGKIGLQIAAKQGKTLWTVTRRHDYWKGRNVATASFTYSRGLRNQFTFALVGTTNNDQSSVYSYCLTGQPRREQAAPQIYLNFFERWLKKYLDVQKVLPSTLVIYRQGLSDARIKSTVSVQLDQLYKVIQSINKIPEHKGYNPEIAFFTVNKRVNARFYDDKMVDNKRVVQNPSSGSVIFCELASANLVDFYLVAQKVTSGTATPTQYRLIYYHRQGTPIEIDGQRPEPTKEENKFDLPLNALAQLTYEQCFMYYNWQGAVKVPAVMQCASKVSKLAGEHINENVNFVDFVNYVKKELARLSPGAESEEMLKKLNAQCGELLGSYYFL